MDPRMSRRLFLRSASLAGAAMLAACAPKVVKETVLVEKEVEKIVEKEVTKIVKEAVEVEKEVTRVVEKVVEAPPAESDAVVIRLHYRAGGEISEWPMYIERPKLFMAENPDIVIELAPVPGGEYAAKIMTMAAADTIGDVMWTSDVWTEHSRYVKLGVLAAVDDYLDKFGKTKDEWLDACVDTLTHDGKMYGLPKCSHPGDSYIWINVDMFEEAGITPPETYGASLEDISEWSAKLAQGAEGDRSVYGYMPSNSHIMGIYNPVRSFGGMEATPDGMTSLTDSPEWFNYAKWTKDFYDKGQATIEGSLPSGGITALFAGGKLAMMHRQRYMYKRVREAVEKLGRPFTWRVIQFPHEAGARGWTACVDTHTATAASKHPEEAFRWTYAMADPVFTELVAKNIGYLGGRKDDIDTIEPFAYPFLKLQYGNGLQEEKFNQPPNARGREVQTMLVNSLQMLWLGEEELSEGFMSSMKSDIDDILAKPF